MSGTRPAGLANALIILKKLIERDASDLDCYADLSGYGADVEGLTEFLPDQKPVVKISASLTNDERRENRLRTTLTHEYIHVRLHGDLFQQAQSQCALFENGAFQTTCKRDVDPLALPQRDWMEWQAGYGGGALLMPASHVRKAAEALLTEHSHYGAVGLHSELAAALIDLLAEEFQVSADAARIRLLKLGLLGEAQGQALFH
jgi:Zn-dependent peptidase ImmA (M78 family)